MFDKLKGVSAVAGLLKNQDRIRDIGDRVRKKMESTRVLGEAGGGAVRCVMTGGLKLVEVELSPALANGVAADDKTRRAAGSLICEATNQALQRAQNLLKEEIQKEAKALGLGDMLPDMGNLIGL